MEPGLQRGQGEEGDSQPEERSRYVLISVLPVMQVRLSDKVTQGACARKAAIPSSIRCSKKLLPLESAGS